MANEKEETLPLFDMSAMPTEEAVRHLVEEYGELESVARFMVAMAKGEITGDIRIEASAADAPDQPAA